MSYMMSGEEEMSVGGWSLTTSATGSQMEDSMVCRSTSKLNGGRLWKEDIIHRKPEVVVLIMNFLSSSVSKIPVPRIIPGQ